MAKRRRHSKLRKIRNTRSHGTSARRRLNLELLEPRLAMTVIINEILADNESGIEDAAGHRHDWIELKNTGGVTENIAGWYLTDDAGQLTKWQIPSTPETTSLAPGEYLLIFASGNNGEVGVVGTEIHTNFQLSQESGFVGLVRANGTTIEDSFNLYPDQSADVSYGPAASAGSTTTQTLITSGTADPGDGTLAYFRPFTGPNAAVDDFWLDADYMPTGGAGWSTVTNGVGTGYTGTYQDSTASLAGQIGGYVRIPFNVTDAALFTSMNLELRVDNGYVLFLNGREVKRERVHTDFKIGNDWENNSRENIANATMLASPAVLDLTPWLDTIVDGTNVLGIYVANHTSDTADFLVHANLTAQKANGSVADAYMVAPTPSANNGAGWLGVITDTTFSHDRGFYDAAFNLEITTVEPGTTIRYTTDGTAPTLLNGTTYTGPINISSTTTLRAAAFKTGYYSSNVDTQTYVFLDDILTQDATGLTSYTTWGSPPDWSMNPAIVSAVGAEQLKEDMKSIPSMSLVMDWEEFFGDGAAHGIYTENTTWKNSSDERATSVEFFTGDGSEEFQLDGVVEIQGHSSVTRWNTDKLSLQIKFKSPYDGKIESDTLFGNSAVDGENAGNDFDNLILDAQFNYTWLHSNPVQHSVAKYLNDQIVSDLVNEAGGNSPHGRWVNLYINGLYWGIYNLHERPDDSFAAEYFGGDEDDYYAVKAFDGVAGVHVEQYLTVDGGLSAETAYANLLNQADDAVSSLVEYQQVQAILDIDSFIDYMVVHYYAGNWDWGQDNWYATFNHVDANGKWRFHTWDQEHAWPTDDNADTFFVTYDSTTKNDAYGPTGIHRDLMASDEYRLRFSDRVQELMRNDGVLTPDAVDAVWQARIDELSGAINGEAARWGDNRANYNGADWLDNVQYVQSAFIPIRTDIVIDQFNLGGSFATNDWLATLAAPNFSQYGGEFTSGYDLVLTNPNGSGTLYYTLDGSDPRAAGGGLSGSAIAYTGPIDLTESVQVRARVFNSGVSGTKNDWSAEVDKTFTLDEPYSLRIVELMYNPPGGDDLTEYIELLNTGSEAIDLAGVKITEFSSEGYTFTSGTLDPGERIVVVANQAAFQVAYGVLANVAPGVFDGGLSNNGEPISLLDPFGELIQRFTYGDSTLDGWPDAPDGDGNSLVYIGPLNAMEDPADTTTADPFEDPANWVASASDDPGGSPGAAEPSSGILYGDYNGNDLVDAADYTVWRDALTAGSSVLLNDFTPGVVDESDFTYWRSHFGETLGSGAGQATSGAAQASSATPKAEEVDTPAPVVAAVVSPAPAPLSTTSKAVEPAPESNLGTSVSLVLPGQAQAVRHVRPSVSQVRRDDVRSDRFSNLLQHSLRSHAVRASVDEALGQFGRWRRWHRDEDTDGAALAEAGKTTDDEPTCRAWEDADWLQAVAPRRLG